MSELSRIMKNVLASPEVADASKKQLEGVLHDLRRTDPLFPKELGEEILQDLHAYFFRHQFSVLKENMPEKVKNWVMFHQNEYQKKKDEENEKK
ncbi:hypothetical protein HYW94_04520 [Candidatus Uhrbacteria bacterium]|nr:hypothetical protein [Candidatus Uhrbacteria bacterium]